MTIGLNFSKRKNGNCRTILEYIGKSNEYADISIHDIPNYSIKSCCDFNYACFKTGYCLMKDDFKELIELIIRADEVFVTVPVYSGHLCSEYFKFHERLCGDYRLDDKKLADDYLDKTTYIIIANRGHGYERAVDSLNHDIRLVGGRSKLIPVASGDYDLSSVRERLVDSTAFCKDLNNWLGLTVPGYLNK